MKKMLYFLVSLLFVCVLPFAMVGCSNQLLGGKEHDVTLVLVQPNGSTTKKVLTSQTSGATIYNPKDYHIYPVLISNYVVVNDIWYTTKSLSSSVYFPCTMPNEGLELYAAVRPLSYLNQVSFANPESVHAYFSSNATLEDDFWNTPDENSESSYYEISEYSVVSIKNIMRYYPATQKVILMRGYSKSENLGGFVAIQDEFLIAISIDLTQKTINCKGVYSRTGVSSSSVAGGSVTITYNVNKISIDDTTRPLLPNFSTIRYTYEITNATNYNKMKDLWNSSGDDYAEKCYAQANSLLKSINNRILIFS